MHTNSTSNTEQTKVSLNGLSYDAQLPLTLCTLAARGDVEQLRILIPNLSLADISRGDYDNRTPLHLASEEGHMEAVKLLVESGANINATDRWGGTPLQGSLKHNHTSIAKYLKKNGAREISNSKESADTLQKDVPYP